MTIASPLIRILIADDHAILRDGLRTLLEGECGFIVVGEAADGVEAARLTRELAPDVLLLDLAMPIRPGLEVLREVLADARPVRTILLTATIKNDEIVKALQLGVRGVVLKESATQLLFHCIRTVMAGGYWVGDEAVSDLVGTLRALGVARGVPAKGEFGLTRRELDIVSSVAGGHTNKQIAAKYSLSEETIKHRLTRIYTKLGVANRLELAMFASHNRVIR